MTPAFYISELRITGENVEAASIKFEKGLNYITGLSNTGKSYIYSCIDYVFGADKIKELRQFKDYIYIFVELTTANGDKKTLMRKRNDKKVLLFDTSIADAENNPNPSLALNGKFSGRSNKDVGSYLLSLIGISDNPVMMKGAGSGNTALLSLRNYIKFFFVDETRIIDDKQKIISDPYSDTLLVSIFRYILTGQDDRSCVPIEKPEIRKARIHGRIEMLCVMQDRMLVKERRIRAEISQLQDTAAYESIDEYQNQIVSFQTLIDDRTQMLVSLESKHATAEQDYAKETAVYSRLVLLKEQYESDLDRLGFIIDGIEISHRAKTDICPLCYSKGIIGTEDDEDHTKNLEAAYSAESSRIQKLLCDLEPVILESKKHIEFLQTELDTIQKQIDIISTEIKEIVDIKISPLKGIVDQYSQLMNLKRTLTTLGCDLVDIQHEIDAEKRKLEEKGEEQTYKPSISADTENSFCEYILKILNEWNVKCNRIILNGDKRDFTIDEQERISNGKGYRALYFSAYVYAIHLYLRDSNRPYFPCVMLDSPLTTLRGEEKTEKTDSDAVNRDIQSAMLDYVANLDSVQSIILENKEIDPSIEAKANVIRFSGSATNGRFGLFPVHTE